MILYPEVQKKGQEEIDRVVGNQRLPDYSDKDSLPYITAMMKETFRWHPPAPTGTCSLRPVTEAAGGLTCSSRTRHSAQAALGRRLQGHAHSRRGNRHGQRLVRASHRCITPATTDSRRLAGESVTTRSATQTPTPTSPRGSSAQTARLTAAPTTPVASSSASVAGESHHDTF